MDNRNDQDNRENWENPRDNWNNWQEEQEKKNWDHWNSNASNSSYYNQPTHKPYDQGFSIASRILGLLSLTLGCCGISIPLGALGILFAMLCYRKGRSMNSNARMGLYLSVFGLVYGIVMIIYTIFVQLPAMLQNPAYVNQMNQLYQMLFGMDFEEFMQMYYGSSI